jgi:hypothetical protein
MGREQRSRRYLPPDAICYLCGLPIAPDQPWNRDHVPPERVFGKRVRQEHAVDLKWLPTHAVCNTAFKDDEEYFVVSLAGHHQQTATGRAVWDDIRRGAAAGHGLGLLKTIIGQFGKVQLSDGSRTFALDRDRSHRVAWKIARGLYTLESGRTLPESQSHNVDIVPQSEGPRRLPNHSVFPFVRDTASLGRYEAVFDYKWICVPVGDARCHAIGFLLWDSLVVLVLFHDPTCRCDECAPTALESGDGR